MSSNGVQFLNVPQLAEMLGVKKRTVYEWVAQAAKTKIPIERAGGSLRFRLDRILQWTEERGRQSESA
ncbi:MAG: hypothetical protein DMF68_00265 [Acidobacteria bacterium]|nr:MAG: hypothetical protein DMF68_00265 [Acidobacteriota bacterium]